MIRLTIHNLNLRRDGVILLDEVGIEARPGHIHVVVGPADSGKSVLARALAGLEEDCTGEIYLDGRDMIDIPPDKRRIGYVPAGPCLWPGYSVGSNVEYGLKQRGIARLDRRNRISEALGWFGVDSLKHRRVEELTALEARKVAFARALAVDPQVLVADEPLKNLSEVEARTLRDDIVRVQSEQRLTTVILTSLADFWWEDAHRMSLLSDGSILQTGTPEEVFLRPSSLKASSFFGECNVIDGVAEAFDPRGEALVRTGCGRLLGKVASSKGTVPKSGDQVLVLIRPEAISFSVATGSTSTQVNRVPVRVLRSTFSRYTYRYDLGAPGDISLAACLTSGQAAGVRPESNQTALIPSDQISIVPIDSSKPVRRITGDGIEFP
jgi:ABC-type Fe3+/spermidine/putrescine transport system ATPase subunit